MIVYNVADTDVVVLCAVEIVDVINSCVTDIAELIACWHIGDVPVVGLL